MPLAVVAAILACYLPYLGAGWGVFGFLTAGYISEEGLRERRGDLAGRAHAGAARQRAGAHGALPASSRPASWLGSACASRSGADARRARPLAGHHPAAHRRPVPDVAELRLVFPRARAVHPACRRAGRAGLGADARRVPALPAALSCRTTSSPGRRSPPFRSSSPCVVRVAPLRRPWSIPHGRADRSHGPTARSIRAAISKPRAPPSAARPRGRRCASIWR